MVLSSRKQIRPRWPTRQRTLNTFVAIHFTATEFLNSTEEELIAQPRKTNTILPHARKVRASEPPLSFQILSSPSSSPSPSPWNSVRRLRLRTERESYFAKISSDQFWLTCWSRRSSSGQLILDNELALGNEPILASEPTLDSEVTLDFVIACTKRKGLGPLPIFGWSPYETSTLPQEWLKTRLERLIATLLEYTPVTRVFSFFSPTPITYTFAACFTQMTGVQVVTTAYYSAVFTHVTRETLTESDPTRSRSNGQQYELRLALNCDSDIERVAQHCYEFARGDVFEIDPIGARLEAQMYIKCNQVYVCEVKTSEGKMEFASIVAVTRNAESNAMITKVHTDPRFRGYGYAEELVRYVCKRLLYEHEPRYEREPGDTKPYQTIALYVGHNNSAARVYDRCGFAGLCGKPQPAGVEDVLELGFEGADKGYW